MNIVSLFNDAAVSTLDLSWQDIKLSGSMTYVNTRSSDNSPTDGANV